MKYCIINKSDVSNMVWDQLVIDSEDTLRWNLDNTETIVQFEGNRPSFLNGFTEYTLEQITFVINDLNNGWITKDLFASTEE